MHGTLMVLSQCRRNYTPVSVSTASGYAGVPPAYVVRCAVCIKQAGRLRIQSLPLAVLTLARV